MSGYKFQGLTTRGDMGEAWRNLARWASSVVRSIYFVETSFGFGALSITATTEASAQTVVDGVSYTPDLNAWYEILFSCPSAVAPAPTGRLIFVLFENDTAVGQIAALGASAGTASPEAPIFGRSFRNPSVGTDVKWSVRAYVTSGTGTVKGGSGGSGDAAPATLIVNLWCPA